MATVIFRLALHIKRHTRLLGTCTLWGEHASDDVALALARPGVLAGARPRNPRRRLHWGLPGIVARSPDDETHWLMQTQDNCSRSTGSIQWQHAACNDSKSASMRARPASTAAGAATASRSVCTSMITVVVATTNCTPAVEFSVEVLQSGDRATIPGNRGRVLS